MEVLALGVEDILEAGSVSEEASNSAEVEVCSITSEEAVVSFSCGGQGTSAIVLSQKRDNELVGPLLPSVLSHLLSFLPWIHYLDHRLRQALNLEADLELWFLLLHHHPRGAKRGYRPRQ